MSMEKHLFLNVALDKNFTLEQAHQEASDLQKWTHQQITWLILLLTFSWEQAHMNHESGYVSSVEQMFW